MSLYDGGSRNRIVRWLLVLAAVIFFIFVIIGGLLAANYKDLGNLMKVVSLVRTQYLYPVSTGTLVDGTMHGIVESLNDPYSVYMDRKTFTSLQEQIRGSFGGLGILVGVQDHYLTVARAYEGTPAQKAGIRKGDVITRINNHDARNIDLETAINMMRGPVGTKINLTIARKGMPKTLNVQLVREEISVPTVEGKILPGTGIGYIQISQFTEKTPQEMDAVVASLKKGHMQSVLLDLRDNPGGELQSAVKVANYFVPRGPVVYIDYRTGRDETYSSTGTNLGLPLVALVNGNTASAAEILAGAIKDTHSGVLVGEKTFGKGIVQTVFDLGNGAGLKLTTARYLTPARHDINKKGIVPDVVVAQPVHATVDLQLQKGIDLLQQKMGAKAAA